MTRALGLDLAPTLTLTLTLTLIGGEVSPAACDYGVSSGDSTGKLTRSRLPQTLSILYLTLKMAVAVLQAANKEEKDSLVRRAKEKWSSIFD